jgi:NADPH:quinone reductase-like Zn-dependent oxidoreductase
LINIVRREEQQVALKAVGAEHVLNSSDHDFKEKLTSLSAKLNATVLFEAVGGETTGIVMDCMPYNSICIIYGVLSEKPIEGLDPILMIGKNQRLEGFFLGTYFAQKSTWATMGIFKQCITLMANKTFESQIAKRVSMFELREAIAEYKANMSVGKYIIYPQEGPPTSEQS